MPQRRGEYRLSEVDHATVDQFEEWKKTAIPRSKLNAAMKIVMMRFEGKLTDDEAEKAFDELWRT